MSRITYVLSILLVLGLNNGFCQADLTQKLLNKKWTIKHYEVDGKFYGARDIRKRDYVLFRTDSVETVTRGVLQNSRWKYDAGHNFLTLYSDDQHIKAEMKVLIITDEQLVWETTNPKGKTIKVYMFVKAK